MASSNGSRVAGGNGLTKGATIRFDARLSHELEVYCAVLGWTQRQILEEGLSLFIKANPLKKKERESAEYLMTRRR